jgi:hypothetical protein
MGYKKLPLQPFNRFAEVLLAVIECDVGKSSVPPSMLSYLSPSRRMVLVAPRNNLAAPVPKEPDAANLKKLKIYRNFTVSFRRTGEACRANAEARFIINQLAEWFEGALGNRRKTNPSNETMWNCECSAN